MATDPAQQLLDALTAGTIPIDGRQRSRHRLPLWIALRDGDKAALRIETDWAPDRRYRVDPLPTRINAAFADLLYGEPPEFTPAQPSDEELLADLIAPDGANIGEGLRTAVADLSSPEGEAWWRIYTDPDESSYPVVDWHSRVDVAPLWRGRRLQAVAFISNLTAPVGVRGDGAGGTVWRAVQIHSAGRADNLLFEAPTGSVATSGVRGAGAGIGQRRALTAHPDVAHLPEQWVHGLGLLAGRLPNRLGDDHRDGAGDYDGVEDLLLDLHEAHTIEAENYRLAGKKRAVLPERFADERGAFDHSEEVFWAAEQAGDPQMPEGRLPDVFKLLSYDYDAAGARGRKDDLALTILTRVGLARQMVDANQQGEGTAVSGTALRTRLIPMVLVAQGKGRVADRESRRLVGAAQQVDALPLKLGGFARSWSAAGELPTVQRGSVLPEDPGEELERQARAVGAELVSRETAIRELNPQWSEEQLVEELERIRADAPTVGAGRFDNEKPVEQE